MTHADKLYNDCLEYWQNVGVEKEDNCMALAMLDVVNAKVEGWERYSVDFYLDKGREICRELMREEYNENRGRSGWLKDKGF